MYAYQRILKYLCVCVYVTNQILPSLHVLGSATHTNVCIRMHIYAYLTNICVCVYVPCHALSSLHLLVPAAPTYVCKCVNINLFVFVWVRYVTYVKSAICSIYTHIYALSVYMHMCALSVYMQRVRIYAYVCYISHSRKSASSSASSTCMCMHTYGYKPILFCLVPVPAAPACVCIRMDINLFYFVCIYAIYRTLPSLLLPMSAAHLCVCTLAAPKEVWISHSITRSWQIHVWQIHLWLIQNVSFSRSTHSLVKKIRPWQIQNYKFKWLIQTHFSWLFRTLFIFKDSFMTDSFVTHSDSCMMQRRSVGSSYICMHISSS